MKTNELLQKTFEYNKTGFERFYNTVTTLQEKAEQLTIESVEGTHFIPEKGKALLQQYIEASKGARENTKQAVTRGHEQIEKLIAAI